MSDDERVERLQREVEALRESRDYLESQATSLRGELETVSSRLRALRESRWWRIGLTIKSALRRPSSVAKVFRKRQRRAPRGGARPSVAFPPETQRRLAGVSAAPRRPADLWVAAVMDEFSRACFAPECSLVTPRPDSWRAALEERPPHLLLVESAWEGNAGSWQYQVGTYSYAASAGLPHLTAMVRWCRERGIPAVFWNKEDPIHYDRFREAAALFDVVLTSDANCVPRYRAPVIEALPFGAQPRIHNPIALAEPRLDAPCFAGTYYRNRHPDRRRQLEMLLDAARPLGLVIYDRMFGRDDPAFGFPERFAPHVAGRLPYEQVVRTYKRHKVFLNTNSVTDSPTMFSRRVYELLACGTPVVSTPSAGIKQTFGDVVAIVETEEEARAAIERLLHDDEHRRRVAAAGVRLVLGEHTYRERLAAVARAAGFPVDPLADEAVAVVALADGAEQAARLADAVAAQARAPAEVLLGVAAPLSDRATDELRARLGPDRTRIVEQAEGVPASERLRSLAALAASPWVAVLDARHDYEHEYLRDLAMCTRFADAGVIGHACRIEGGIVRNPELEHRFTSGVHPRAAIARRELVAARGWPDTQAAERVMRDWFAEGVRFYGAGREGFRAAATAQPIRLEAAPAAASEG